MPYPVTLNTPVSIPSAEAHYPDWSHSKHDNEVLHSTLRASGITSNKVGSLS